MEECLYEPVKKKSELLVKKIKNNEIGTSKYLFRQIIVCSGIWNSFFVAGLCLGTPTVLIPQFRREANSSEAISDEMASWISSIHGYAALPWFILPILSAWIGRKYPFYIVSIVALISFIVLYFSNSPTQVLIAEILQAPLFTCHISISIVIVTEYTSPKYRGLFLTLKSASLNWGMWVANALGTFLHWRAIAVAGIICSMYNLLTTLYWCESPSWLASKYRFEECTIVHRWIKGRDLESEKELEALKQYCKEYQEEHKREENKQTKLFQRSFRTLTEKAFFKPLLLCIGMLSLYHTSGKLICSVYAIDIIKEITSAESTAYFGMLMLDAVTVTGMYIGSGLSKFIKRRVLLLTGSSGGISFLVILALYLFLGKLEVINENKYVSLALLTLFFLFISCGPIILSSSIYGELMPLRYRTASMFLTGVWTETITSTTLKTAPQLFSKLGLHGAFLFYGVVSSFIIVLLYKYLPETKDKTLQEIEESLVGKIRKDELPEVELIL